MIPCGDLSKKKFKNLGFIALIYFLLANVDCINDVYSSFFFEWQILNNYDSLIVKTPIDYNISLNDRNYTADIFSDSFLVDQGLLVGEFCISASSEDVNRSSPTVTITLTQYKQKIFDTTISWCDLNFKMDSTWNGYKNQNVSKRVFYVSLPETGK